MEPNAYVSVGPNKPRAPSRREVVQVDAQAKPSKAPHRVSNSKVKDGQSGVEIGEGKLCGDTQQETGSAKSTRTTALVSRTLTKRGIYERTVILVCIYYLERVHPATAGRWLLVWSSVAPHPAKNETETATQIPMPEYHIMVHLIPRPTPPTDIRSLGDGTRPSLGLHHHCHHH